MRVNGLLEAFPGLDVYLPHAGGTFPWLIGRFDYAIGNSPSLSHMKKPASAYLGGFFYDVILFNAQIMRNLIDLVGVDRVVMGTDYPQGMAVKQPVDFVESVPGLSLREREMILSANAQRLLLSHSNWTGIRRRSELHEKVVCRAPRCSHRARCVR